MSASQPTKENMMFTTTLQSVPYVLIILSILGLIVEFARISQDTPRLPSSSR